MPRSQSEMYIATITSQAPHVQKLQIKLPIQVHNLTKIE